MSKVKSIQKKVSKKNEKVEIKNTSSELSNLIKIVVAIVSVFLIFYIITVVVTKKDDKKPVEKPEIQYKEILTGNLLKQNSKEYFVLAQAEKDFDLAIYSTFLTQYEKNTDSLPVYNTIIYNPLNKEYFGENNLDINAINTNISNLKISTSALFKVKDGQVIMVLTNKDEIVKYLTELTKTEEN